MVKKPIDQLKEQVTTLEEEKKELEKASENQLQEISKLEKEINRLKTVEGKLNREKQKCKEQERRLQQLDTELTETKADLDKAQNEELVSMKDKLSKTSSELGYVNKRLRATEEDNHKLKLKMKELLEDVSMCEKERSKQAYEMELLNIEMDNTRKQADDALNQPKELLTASFQDYVKLKRELSEIKAENRKLQKQLSKIQNRKYEYLKDEGIGQSIDMES